MGGNLKECRVEALMKLTNTPTVKTRSISTCFCKHFKNGKNVQAPNDAYNAKSITLPNTDTHKLEIQDFNLSVPSLKVHR